MTDCEARIDLRPRRDETHHTRGDHFGTVPQPPYALIASVKRAAVSHALHPSVAYDIGQPLTADPTQLGVRPTGMKAMNMAFAALIAAKLSEFDALILPDSG